MTYPNDFPKGLVFNPSVILPYCSIKVGETCVAICECSYYCMVGRIVGLEGDKNHLDSIVATIDVGGVIKKRNIIHDLKNGTLFIINPFTNTNIKEEE